MGDGGLISAMVMAAGEAESLRARFAEHGFEAGNAVGGTFAITGPKALFEQVFRVPIELGEQGPIVAGGEGDARELPLEGLPPDLRSGVRLATFSPPPDFGPTGW